MLGNAHPICFLASVDFGRAREFYEQKLGLTFISADDFALVFDSNGTMLRIQKVGRLDPAERTVLGWSVAAITEEVKHLSRRGIVFARYPGIDQDQDAIWTSPGGSRVAWFKDPDGNLLSLTEFR